MKIACNYNFFMLIESNWENIETLNELEISICCFALSMFWILVWIPRNLHFHLDKLMDICEKCVFFDKNRYRLPQKSNLLLWIYIHKSTPPPLFFRIRAQVSVYVNAVSSETMHVCAMCV